MAINAFSILLATLAFSSALTAVKSHSCKSESFALCEHLPALDSQIRYTYNASNSSLSIAFIATPPTPDGWISWSINPTGTGMAGAQAFVAYQFNNTLRTTTLNITGYHNLTAGRLSFPFWNVSAEKRNGTIALYASMAVPGNKTEVNQVWQVGPGTGADGRIKPHEFSGESLQSKSVVSLTGALTPEAAAPAPGKSKSSSGKLEMRLVLGLVLSFVTLWFSV